MIISGFLPGFINQEHSRNKACTSAWTRIILYSLVLVLTVLSNFCHYNCLVQCDCCQHKFHILIKWDAHRVETCIIQSCRICAKFLCHTIHLMLPVWLCLFTPRTEGLNSFDNQFASCWNSSFMNISVPCVWCSISQFVAIINFSHYLYNTVIFAKDSKWSTFFLMFVCFFHNPSKIPLYTPIACMTLFLIFYTYLQNLDKVTSWDCALITMQNVGGQPDNFTDMWYIVTASKSMYWK